MNEAVYLYGQALKKWGTQAQIDMAFEEMAELMVALSYARRRSVKYKVSKEELVDEITDVRIMLEQMEFIFKLDIQELREARILKLGRLEERLSSGTT